MRTYLNSTLFAIALSVFSIAHAAEESAGILISIDLMAGTLVLSDNVTYILPENFENPGFDSGDEVVILWNNVDDVPVVESVVAAE